MELPYATIGLVWNSMMSVAGGWFFLMACEMFTLGNRDLRLPGLGSYLQTAANEGNTHAIFWGLGVMVTIIILIDQLIWRPVIAWAEKFKFEQVESAEAPHSPVLDFLRSSKILSWLGRFTTRPSREYVTLYFARRRSAEMGVPDPSKSGPWIWRLTTLVTAGALIYAFVKIVALLSHLTRPELSSIAWGAGATFLRVIFTLFLAGLWTVPIGVLIGLKPKVAALAQPIVQILASVPATALFPVILLILIRAGGGLGIGSIVLLLLGTQWYLLFNIIAGSMSIPTDLKEVTSVFRFGRMERWRELFLPGIFPFLITGFITASGGAWNASIVAEYFRFRGKTYSVTGLGAVISNATDTGNFALLLGATIVMAAMVVTINRLVWRRLYAVAATRYKLEN
jgi:NitT/TauT family transport system permease protein